jgi:hypothetical protein
MVYGRDKVKKIVSIKCGKCELLASVLRLLLLDLVCGLKLLKFLSQNWAEDKKY